MSFLKPRMNRLPRWEGPVLERKSNPGFPRCPQPELEGTCYVEGGSAAPPECENTPANQRPSAGHLAATRGLWGKVLQTTAPRDKQERAARKLGRSARAGGYIRPVWTSSSFSDAGAGRAGAADARQTTEGHEHIRVMSTPASQHWA